MKPPIRIVCEGCLRSVEIARESMTDIESSCPYCGRPVDGSGTSEAETCVPSTPAEPEAADTPETIDWATAWTRGTLGTLGRFQLRERLGDGGFGQVYLAYDPRLDRDVALKVLKQPEPNERVMERFFREARAVARLDHPNIVPVYDAGFDDGRCWVAYQLVSGRPLWWYRDRQRMDPATAARIIRDLAEAVSHAHGMGVVHRDIKPGNVLIDDCGRPRLIDFGLARRSDVDSDLTRDGVIMGTPAYMSPEQAVGQSRQADERSDVYSLGVIFYELLCGRRPQDMWSKSGSTGTGTGPPRPSGAVPRVRTFHRGVPRLLDAICATAMSSRPEDRYPTARAMAEEIDRWLANRRPTGRRAAIAALSVLVAVGLVLAAASLPGTVAIREEGTSKEAARASTDAGPRPVVVAPPAVAGEATVRKDGPSALVRGQVVASRNAKRPRKFHIVPCRYADDIEVANRVFFESPEEARERGYELCGICKSNRPKAEAEAEPEPSD